MKVRKVMGKKKTHQAVWCHRACGNRGRPPRSRHSRSRRRWREWALSPRTLHRKSPRAGGAVRCPLGTGRGVQRARTIAQRAAEVGVLPRAARHRVLSLLPFESTLSAGRLSDRSFCRGLPQAESLP